MRPDEIARANRSARASGAVGPRAIVPATVREWLRHWSRPATVLDYGAGPKAAHTQRLRAEYPGHRFTAHDFGANIVPGVHDLDALTRQYDIVFASNVLNVQPTVEDVARVLVDMRNATAPGGVAVFNFPAKPNYGPALCPAEVVRMAEAAFCVVSAVRGRPRCWSAR